MEGWGRGTREGWPGLLTVRRLERGAVKLDEGGAVVSCCARPRHGYDLQMTPKRSVVCVGSELGTFSKSG